MTDESPPEFRLGDYVVFLKNGKFDSNVNDVKLHQYARREDYGFALATAGVDTIVEALCEKHQLSPTMFGELLEEAVIQGALSAGVAAVMTLETQRISDSRDPRPKAKD